MYATVNDILYYVGPKQMEISGVAVPQQMHLQEYHDGWLAGHFSGPKLTKPWYKAGGGHECILMF